MRRPDDQREPLGQRELTPGEGPLQDGLGESPRLAMQRSQSDGRAEREPDEEHTAEVQVVEQAEEVVDQVLVA